MPEGRLQQLRVVDPVLTELSRGYSNAAFIAEALFPIAEIAKEGGKIPQFGKDAFRIYDTERAIGADPKRIQPGARSTIPVVLTEHSLEYPMDKREDEESMFDEQTYGTNVTTEGINLKREKLSADLAQAESTYENGMKVALAGTEKFSDKTSSDPIGVVEDGKEAVRKKIGVRPNTLVMGAAVFADLKFHPQLVEKFKYTNKGIVTLELMKEIFNIENIVVGEAVYTAEAGFADLWLDNMILTYVPKKTNMRSVYQPSFGYTIRKKGNPVVYRYDEPNGKVTVVQATDIFEVKVVGAESGYLIKSTH